jgi:hypothetical protein
MPCPQCSEDGTQSASPETERIDEEKEYQCNSAPSQDTP